MGNAVNELKKIVYGDAPATAGTSSVDRLRNIVAGKEKISVTPENSYAYKQKNKPAPRVESVAQSSTPTFGERVASTFSGFFDRQKSNYAGAAENLLEIVRDLDKKNSEQFRKANTEAENAARYQKMLDEGKWADGTILTAEDRKRVQSLMEDSKKRSAIYAESNEKIHQPISNVISKVETYGDETAKASEEALTKAKEGAGTLGKVAVDLGVVAGDVATDALMNAMIPGLGSAARATRMYGQGAETAEDKGRGLGAQALYGGTTAALGELSNRMFNSNPILQQAFGKGALDDVILPGLNATKAGRIFKSGLGEALEETGENYADKIAQALIFREDADKLSAKDIGYDALIAALFGSASSAVSPAPRNRLQQSSASLTASSEGSNAPETKAQQNASKSVSEGVSEQAKIPQFGNDLLNIAADEQVANGRPTNSMVEAIIKSPEALQELGVNSNGKTNSQLRAEVRQSIERAVADGETEVAASAVEAPAQEEPIDVIAQEARRAFTEPAPEVQTTPKGDGLGAADLGFDPYSNLQNQSNEFYPEGANAARPVDMPMYDADGKPISQVASTVMGAGAIPDDMIPTVEQMVADGLLSHNVNTDAQAMQNAENTIKDIGWDGAIEKLRNATKNGYVSKDMTVLAERMLVNAANAKDAKQFTDILVMYQTMRTNVGQAMQAGTLLRKMSPEWQLYGVQRSVANLKNELEQKHKNKAPDLQISEKRIAEFLAQTDQAGRDAVMEKIYKDIAKKVPSNWKDKWDAWRYLSMLANPRTHIRNIGGNIGFQPVRIIKNEIASVLEGLYSATGRDIERTKSFAVSPALYRAAWNDFGNAKNLLDGNRYESATGKIMQERDIFGFKPLEGVRRGNSKALEWEDAVFKRITYADSLAQYLKANGVTAAQMESGNVDTALLTKARDYAAKEAMKATYQDSNVVSDAVERAVKGFGVFGEAIMPFKRTPANILARALEYSPAGLAKSLTADLVRVKRGDITASQAIDSIASGITGTGLLGLGMYLFARGLVTPGQGDDEEGKWEELLGHQGYALELDDGTSVTLDWLAPESLPFFMGVELMSALGENGFQADDISDALASVAEPMLELSMLQSVNDMIDSVSYADSNKKLLSMVGSAVISYFSQAIPTLGGQIERSSEDVRMTTYTDKNSPIPTDIQYAFGKASAKLPGDYAQIPYIDAWGRTESTGDPIERAANNLLNPAYVSHVDVDNVEKELQRLYDAVGSEYGSLFPDRAAKYITDAKGNRKDFTADEYVAYAKDLGQTTYNLISEAMKTSAYKSGSNAAKAEYIDRIYGYAGALARSKAGGKPLEGYQLNAKNAKRDIGVSSAEYLALYEKYGSEVMSGKAYEKVKQAVKAGLSVDEYVSAKNKANTDGKTGVNKEEAMAFLKNNPKRADLWDIINTTGANNPYK